MDLGSLAYLGLLLAVLALWFFAQARKNLGKTLQQALSWGLIFVGFIAAFGLWDDIRNTVAPQQSVFQQGNRIELPRAPDGHYYITLQINKQPVRFVVDTGASGIVLTEADAIRIGIVPSTLAYVGRANTANGMVRTAPIRLNEISIGNITDTNLGAFVNQGEMDSSLLGMSYLQRYSKIEITNGALVLTR